MRRVRIGTALVVAIASLVVVASGLAATVDMTTSKSVAPREHCGGFNGHVRYGSVVYESGGSRGQATDRADLGIGVGYLQPQRGIEHDLRVSVVQRLWGLHVRPQPSGRLGARRDHVRSQSNL